MILQAYNLCFNFTRMENASRVVQSAKDREYTWDGMIFQFMSVFSVINYEIPLVNSNSCGRTERFNYFSGKHFIKINGNSRKLYLTTFYSNQKNIFHTDNKKSSMYPAFVVLCCRKRSLTFRSWSFSSFNSPTFCLNSMFQHRSNKKCQLKFEKYRNSPNLRKSITKVLSRDLTFNHIVSEFAR